MDPASAVATGAAEAYPRIVGALIRMTGDWDLAEDCAQEALASALQRWPSTGVPDNPAAWLMTTARNRAIDVLRRASVERSKLRDLAVLSDFSPATAPDGFPDDRLRLIFTCCHPALPLEARVALTLRTVCGVRTADIARAFLVTEATMTRRLTRAKTKIAQAGIPYRVPQGPALAERLPGVLGVLYVLFTNGYNADGTPAFADEAIRLARLLRALLPTLSPAPETSEVTGLLALFLFQHSRRAARRAPDGRLLTLEQQDRALWDHAAIAEGLALLAELGAEPADTPARGLTDTPGRGLADTPGRGLSDTPGRGLADTPGRGLSDTPRHGPTGTPRRGLADTSGNGPSEHTPRRGPSDTPGGGIRDAPGDGPYALQARIAALHATAPAAADTDWAGIAGCYDRLCQRQPSAVIALNRAVAHGFAFGPDAGLALLAAARAGGALDGYPHAVAAEAELTSRAGDHARAAVLFRSAAELSHSAAERDALLERAEAESAA